MSSRKLYEAILKAAPAIEESENERKDNDDAV